MWVQFCVHFYILFQCHCTFASNCIVCAFIACACAYYFTCLAFFVYIIHLEYIKLINMKILCIFQTDHKSFKSSTEPPLSLEEHLQKSKLMSSPFLLPSDELHNEWKGSSIRNTPRLNILPSACPPTPPSLSGLLYFIPGCKLNLINICKCVRRNMTSLNQSALLFERWWDWGWELTPG